MACAASSTPPPTATPSAMVSWPVTWLMTLAWPACLSSTSANTKTLDPVQKVEFQKPVKTRIEIINGTGGSGV
ncbi:hypothetical protein D3C72_2186300 [compost metagenome]